MASKLMLHMNHGKGPNSYARNSFVQSVQQSSMRPLIDAAILDLGRSNNTLLPTKMVIADLGCSSGPNALSLASMALMAIHGHCLQYQQSPPEVCVLLNDLPGTDFNTVVKDLVTLRQSSDPIVMTGVAPGSFYERLFTSDSLHLVCSSHSLHWLSEAPGDLVRNQIPAYDIDEHARCERFPVVHEAYARQFRKDFTHFLEMRAKELVPGGRMVVSLSGKYSNAVVSESYHIWGISAQILRTMASEGVIDREKYESFYVPMHGPTIEEMTEIIQEEGSFWIKDVQVHDLTTGVDSTHTTSSWFTKLMRSTLEPIVVQHFGEVFDEFVRTAERRWSREGIFQAEYARYPVAMLTVSLAKA